MQASSAQASDPHTGTPAYSSSVDEMPIMQRILVRKQSSCMAAAEPCAVRSEMANMQARQGAAAEPRPTPAVNPGPAGAPGSCPVGQLPCPSGQPGNAAPLLQGTAPEKLTAVAAASKPAPSPRGRPRELLIVCRGGKPVKSEILGCVIGIWSNPN